MQATLDTSALKPFTRALNCLSRYGEELTLYATPESISLSTTNSSKSAYCRFKYEKEFFSRYRVGQPRQRNTFEDDDVEVVANVTGQLLTKNLLSILKHRTVERAVERCELSIIEGPQTAAGEGSEDEVDSLESRLVVKLLCKHGVVKTHRLLLSVPTSLMAPGVPDMTNESRVTIGPTSLRNMLEHFPVQKGAKADPQLIWTFSDLEVGLKTSESSMDKGKGQLSTELTISSEEFDMYEMYAAPIVIAFHLREFNATIAYADSMSLSLEMRFTDPAAPLFIDVEGDCNQGLFVISTSQVPGAPPPSTQGGHQSISNKRRNREENATEGHRTKKTMKIVQKIDPSTTSEHTSHSRQQSRALDSMPPPSFPGPASFRLSPTAFHQPSHLAAPKEQQEQREPLFLPSSQLSVTENNFLKEAGLGDIGTMEELNAILEGDAEEVDFSPSQAQNTGLVQAEKDTDEQLDQAFDSFELVDEIDFGPSQTTQKGFQPLFND